MPEYYAGIDIGSTMTKVIILTGEGDSVSITGPTGPEHRRLANRVMEKALDKAGLPFEAMTYIVSTGYGRLNVPFADKQLSEISCHAKGIGELFPDAKTIIDIGGQDSKAITVKEGRTTNFIMNDKCAAGTGRFLEIIADSLEVDLERLGELSLDSKNPAEISNICTVWAEQEIKAKLVEGTPLNDLIAGVHESLVSRIVRMVKRLSVKDPVIMTGGVAKNRGVVKVLSDKLGRPISVPAEPLISGALGAALLGKELVKRAAKKGMPLEREHRVLREIDMTSEIKRHQRL